MRSDFIFFAGRASAVTRTYTSRSKSSLLTARFHAVDGRAGPRGGAPFNPATSMATAAARRGIVR